MRNPASFFRSLIILSFLVMTFSPAFADGLQDADKAYERGDYAEAFRLYLPLAQQGDPVAQVSLGFMYTKGLGVTQDDKEAFKWTEKAAQQSMPAAQFILGAMYLIGQGVTQDYKEALKWLEKASLQGIPQAQRKLGVMYEQGLGIPKDYVKAHMWYNLAAGQGNEEAKEFRDRIAQLMTPDQIAEAERLAREWKP